MAGRLRKKGGPESHSFLQRHSLPVTQRPLTRSHLQNLPFPDFAGHSRSKPLSSSPRPASSSFCIPSRPPSFPLQVLGLPQKLPMCIFIVPLSIRLVFLTQSGELLLLEGRWEPNAWQCMPVTPASREAEVGGSWVWRQLGLHRETLSFIHLPWVEARSIFGLLVHTVGA